MLLRVLFSLNRTLGNWQVLEIKKKPQRFMWWCVLGSQGRVADYLALKYREGTGKGPWWRKETLCLHLLWISWVQAWKAGVAAGVSQSRQMAKPGFELLWPVLVLATTLNADRNQFPSEIKVCNSAWGVWNQLYKNKSKAQTHLLGHRAPRTGRAGPPGANGRSGSGGGMHICRRQSSCWFPHCM